MRAELKNLYSPDAINFNKTSPKIDHSEKGSILVQAIVGPKNLGGEESFSFILCTPQWLGNTLLKRKYIFGKALLIVNNFDYDSVHSIIGNLCKRTTGKTWKEIGMKLSQYSDWEFEDYRE